MHMTGMEQFTLPNKRKLLGPAANASKLAVWPRARFQSLASSSTSPCLSFSRCGGAEPMKGQSKKGSSNLAGGKNPLANSMAQQKNPGTSHMNQRGAKLYEIYSSGKSSGGNAGQGANVASNISNGSGGSQGGQNSFLQNKYQFATYYGQKNYPNSGPHMNMLGNGSNAPLNSHH